MRALVERIDRLQRLAVFEAAARTGSFTAAARELGMTQPAVTRQVRALEQRLGAELFRRTSNRSDLTDIGHRLSSHVNAGFDVIESGLQELADHAGTFVVASHPGIAQQWLVPRIDDLHTALGDLELRLRFFDRDAELEAGDHDVAIRVGAGDFPGQSRHLLFDEVVVPVASPALAAEHGLSESSTAADVYQAPFVHMDDDDRPWMTWADWLGRFGIALRRQPGRVLFNNYPMVLQQALAGRGIALGWRPLIDELVEGDALVVVGPEVRSDRGYYVTWRAGPPEPPVETLIAWLTALA
ncbi:MAG: LysR substrate-binding domain-containing protein [Ilumatobacter sp.]|uniref:LysR substrate-binding domain-containing protein n=1 Tax=Ilumatobacter sp. TaxID=1967498 RepID=UPI0026215789|nr:LysR substrate-binding domain-containing protein [Ilumatobacter sp.]MDJ0768668.1 LysR substrate-binding domain-containing protein [Ilumatobacter sp.]